MEWQSWNNLPFTERERLPKRSGIYVVVDANADVWYVGKSANLNSRWRGKGHHRYRQLNRSNNKRFYKIYWQLFPLHQLSEQEELYISLFEPRLNFTKVRKLVPRDIQPDRELSRLLKVLNRKTMLFPQLRSLVIGYYNQLDEDENGELKDYTNIVIGISLNDLWGIIYNSYNKSLTKQGAGLSGHWGIYEHSCGQEDSAEPKIIEILVFILSNFAYEFVACPNCIDVLEQDESMSYNTIEIQEQKVMALPDPSILIRSLDRANNYFFTKEEEYLRHRVGDLRPITELWTQSPK